MQIVDGKKIAAEILAEAKKDIAAFAKKPTLFGILVGNDPASVSFLNEKRKKCEEVDIPFVLHHYPETITTTQLRKKIRDIRKKRGTKSFVIQLPLPPHINMQYILDAIPPEEDVDVLSSRARGLLATGKSRVLPPTAAAILHILATYNLKPETLHVVLVGLGALVGKPLATLLAERVASLTTVHSATPDIVRFTREADVLIAGTGEPGLITGDMVKAGVVALDAGYSRIDGKVSGDLDFEGVAKKASLITPVPGGIGPVTVAVVVQNVVTLAKNN